MEPELPVPNSLFDHLKEVIKSVGQYSDSPPDERSRASYRKVMYLKYVLKEVNFRYNQRTYGACGLCLTDGVPPTVVCRDSKDKSLSVDNSQELTVLWSALQRFSLLIKSFKNL